VEQENKFNSVLLQSIEILNAYIRLGMAACKEMITLKPQLA
jgi:hypothetical protein